MLLATVAVSIIATSCGQVESKYITIDGFAQGSTYHIVYNDPKGRDMREPIEEMLLEFDSVFSLFNPESMISRINMNDSSIKTHEWFTECFKIAEQINHQTDGALDITVRPLVKAYRIGKPDVRTPPQSEVDSLRALVGMQRISLTTDGKLLKEDPRISIDMNAIAQGYSVDLVGRLLEQQGIKDYIVEIGGEVLCRGKNSKGSKWRVGIDRPIDGNMTPGEDLQAVITLDNSALVTSGNYRKFSFDSLGRKVTHTIDPKTGATSQHNLLSATILAPTSTIADGYATACMVIGLEASKRLVESRPELEAYLIYSDDNGEMHIYQTPGVESQIAE